MGDIEDREAIAALVGVAFALVVPVLVLASLIFVCGWLWLLGIQGGHGMLFGWLSTKHLDKSGHPIWGISRVAPAYFFGVVSAYILYQVVELFAGAFRLFREALA